MSDATGLRGMTVEDLYRLRFANKVALSPDGTKLAYTAMTPDVVANRNLFTLYLQEPIGAAPVVLLADQPTDPSPSWSPDGAQLAIVASTNGRPQLCVIDAATHHVQQLTDDDRPISTPLWSPTGDVIAFLARVPSLAWPDHPVEFDESSDTPKVITRARYKFDGLGWFDLRRQQLFVIAPDGSGLRQLTHDVTGVFHPIWTAERSVSIGGPAWSHDGTRLAYVTSTNEDEQRDGRCDVWTVSVASGVSSRVTPNDGLYGCPAWSPDDQSIALVGARLPRKGGGNVDLWRTSSSGDSGLTQVQAAGMCIGASIMSDNGAPGAAGIVWGPAGIYFGCGNQGRLDVWRVDERGGVPEQMTIGDHAIGVWGFDQTMTTLAYCASTPVSPGEVYLQHICETGEAARRVTRLNDEFLTSIQLSEPEEYNVPAQDHSGTDVHGWLLKPPDFSPDQTYPLILEIHGGPHTAYGWSWFHEFQCYAAQGYVLAYCNPRGSSGYGEDFATSIYLDWGTKPMTDVMSALDHVLAEGYVDPEHLYVAGGSYGGYMVDWVVTHTDRFRAAATGRCVSDLRTLALADDNGTLWMAEYFGGMPWEEPDVYSFGSPITHVANCHTPLFIEHQEEDKRCTMDQAEQMYNALKFLGVETEMALYPKESHGMSRNGQPRHRADRLIRTLDWFGRHGGTDARSSRAGSE